MTKIMKRMPVRAILATVVLLAGGGRFAQAQEYPTKAVRIGVRDSELEYSFN